MDTKTFLKSAKKREKKKSEVAEIDIEDAYVSYALTKGCKALKLTFLSRRGFPDRTTLCPGARILFVEFKKKNKGLGLLQGKVKTLLEKYGFTYIVCDEIGQAENYLDRFLKCNGIQNPTKKPV